ncbi:MAG: hypothetical protein HY270_05885 [Deltaproteobacteria bacterium]|nr:hypothetical protein [Deltaproteobacteria bacterium]
MPGILWAAQAACFLAVIACGWRDAPQDGEKGRVAVPIRLGISASLVVAALVINAGFTDATYTRPIGFTRQ